MRVCCFGRRIGRRGRPSLLSDYAALLVDLAEY